VEKATVSVLVPVLNEEAHIRETVAAMQAQEFEGDLEFLFIDGRSEDGTRATLESLAREDPRIRVLDNPGRTTARALNVGLRHARGRYVARMDAHTYYAPGYVALGVDRLERGDVDWVAGPAIPHGTGRWSRRVAMALNSGLTTVGSRKWRVHEDGADLDGEVELDTGVFGGVWRRETLERHGGWDDGWPVNQDSELAARVLAGGGRIVLLPGMGGRYVPRNTLRGLARQYFRYGMYRAKTSRHHPHSLRRSQLMAPGLAFATLLAIVGPRPVRRAALTLLAAYGVAIAAVSVREAASGADVQDAAALPVVFSIMHLSWGLGFLASAFRFGPPAEAVVEAVTGRRSG
jgi:succinoglycan biosynthesis protein ExoA